MKPKKKKPFDKAKWSKTYNKERREWYKARGICCACGSEWARAGRTTCEKCAEVDKARHDRLSEAANARRRETRILRKEAGICTTCGMRPARPGRCTCEKCAKSQRERDIDRNVRKRLEKRRLEYG